MKANFDFSKIDTFETLPQGEYTCFLFDVNVKPTSKGDQMYVLVLKVAEGEYKGRQLFCNLPVLPQTMWKIKETLEAFGAEIPKKAVQVDFDDYLGKKCVAVVDHREWNGKMKEDVQNLIPLDGVEEAAAEFDDDTPF